jgi:hypothetical protein
MEVKMRNNQTLREQLENAYWIIQETHKEIYRKEIIISSLEDSLVSMINSRSTLLTGGMLHKAWMQQNNKKKSERGTYETIKNAFLEEFFDDELAKDVKLKQIMPTGYEQYIYDFKFELEGITFEIGVPAVGNIDKENLKYGHYGQYTLGYEESKGFWKIFRTSYNAADITKALKDFLKERRNSNEN